MPESTETFEVENQHLATTAEDNGDNIEDDEESPSGNYDDLHTLPPFQSPSEDRKETSVWEVIKNLAIAITRSTRSFTLVVTCSVICSAMLFLTICFIIAILSPSVVNSTTDLVSIKDLKRAAIGVGDVTRQSMSMFDSASQSFVDQLRKEYIRRKTYWDEKTQASVGDEWGGGEDGDDDPIEWRYGPHHTLKDFRPEDALPPVCPMLEDHLEIVFSLEDPSFDVYGYPCVMEMHWSVQMELDEIERDEEEFMKYRKFSFEGGGGGSMNQQQHSPPSPSHHSGGNKHLSVGRTNGMPFKSIYCKRKYRMSGFTPWQCFPSKKLPSRYSLVYSVGCVDIDKTGDVNVKSTEEPYSNGKYQYENGENTAVVPKPNKANGHDGGDGDKGDDDISDQPYKSFEFVDLNENDPYRINPAYDKNFQKLEQGHYCHINYAITRNVEWESLRNRPKYAFYLLSFCFVFSVCFLSTSNPTIIFSFITIFIQAAMYILIIFYFDVKPYISYGLTSTLGIISIVFSIGASITLVLLAIFELLTKVKFHCDGGNLFRGPKPLVFLILDKIIRSCSEDHFQPEFSHIGEFYPGDGIYDVPQHYNRTSNRYCGDETIDHSTDMAAKNEEESRVLRPGDRDYKGTVPMNSVPGMYWTGKDLPSSSSSSMTTTNESSPDVFKES